MVVLLINISIFRGGYSCIIIHGFYLRKCKEKIAKSTDPPACAIFLDKGGYTVHPVPAPLSTKDLDKSIINAGIKIQNLILFIRGNAMSAAPNIRGTNQFPKPPIK